MIGKIFNFILFFLYVSNIQFVFLPDKIRTRLIISTIGLLYYFIHYKGVDVYRLKTIVSLIIPLALWMGLSIVLNQSNQIWFLQYVVLQIVFAVGAIFVVDTGKIDSFTHFLSYILIYVLLQDSIAFLSYQIPSITSMLNKVFVSELNADRVELLNIRAMGIGEFGLFGGGAWVAVGVLCLTVLFKLKKINVYIFVPLLLYLLVTGLFVARTSLTGLLALSLLFIPLRKNWYKIVWMAVFAWAFLFIIQRQEQRLESEGYTTYYAFELFDSYQNTGKVQSASLNSTRRMWQTLPTDVGTWVLGDAKYEDEKGGYYMQVDVGFLRVLFYGGLVGLFLYLFYIYRLAKLAYIRSGKEQYVKYFVLIYYLLVLVWMWKGHYDTNCILYLLIASITYGNQLLMIDKKNVSLI